MGIHDRDYMRDNQDPPEAPSGLAMVATLAIIILSVAIAFYSIRLPLPLYFKLPLLVGVGFLLLRLWRLPRKIEGAQHLRQGLIEEGNGNFKRAVYHYEQSARRLPKDPLVRVRLLAAYDSTDRVNRAQDLIRDLDGNVFPNEVREELEFLVSKYRDASFRDIGKGTQVTLGKN